MKVLESFTEEEKHHIRHEFESGVHITALAAKHDTSRQVIVRIVKEKG